MTGIPLGEIDVLTRTDLLAAGMRPRQITRAVREGLLVRLRRDRYARCDAGDVGRAVRVGGRLTCVSMLALFGVFVLDASKLHVHLARTMSRMRSPDDPRERLGSRSRAALRCHWMPLRGTPPSLGVVGLADALAHAVRCQAPRAAIATVDSVLQLGLMSHAEVRDVFAWLPDRYAVILRLSDASAESGPETFMRLILRQLGLVYSTQVGIPGVGRVDFVVEGWLIIECDSKAHHEGWAKQKEDRRRDLAAAALGYSTLRPLAEHLMHERELVVTAVRGLVATRRVTVRRR